MGVGDATTVHVLVLHLGFKTETEILRISEYRFILHGDLCHSDLKSDLRPSI